MHKVLAVCAVTVFLATVSKYIFPFHSFQNGNREKNQLRSSLTLRPSTFTDTKSFEDMIDYRSYEHNLSSQTHDLCVKPTELPVRKKNDSPQNNLTFHK